MTTTDIAQALAATEEAIADLATNPVVPPRPRRRTASPLVEEIAQANQAHAEWVAQSNERNAPMPNQTTTERKRTFGHDAQGRRYVQTMSVGDATLNTITYDADAKSATYEVITSDGRTLPTQIDWTKSRFSVAGNPAKSLAGAVEAVLATDQKKARRTQRLPATPAEGPTTKAKGRRVPARSRRADEAQSPEVLAQTAAGRRQLAESTAETTEEVTA